MQNWPGSLCKAFCPSESQHHLPVQYQYFKIYSENQSGSCWINSNLDAHFHSPAVMICSYSMNWLFRHWNELFIIQIAEHWVFDNIASSGNLALRLSLPSLLIEWEKAPDTGAARTGLQEWLGVPVTSPPSQCLLRPGVKCRSSNLFFLFLYVILATELRATFE